VMRRASNGFGSDGMRAGHEYLKKLLIFDYTNAPSLPPLPKPTLIRSFS